MKDSNKDLGLISSEKFKADGSQGPKTGEKTQRPTSSDFGGKRTGK
jgi:hypothetical protein